MDKGKLLLCILLFIISFITLSRSSDKPFWGEHDWNGVRYGNIARNYLKYGLLETKLGQVENSGYVQTLDFVYLTHYPPLLTLSLALSYKIFGVSEWSTRLIPILFSSGIIVLIFLIGSTLKNITVAFAASLLAIVTPIFQYFGKTPVHEPLVIFFILIAFFGFLTKRKYLLILGLIAAQLTTWAGHFLIPAIILVALIKRNYGLVRSIVPYLLISLATLTVHLTHVLILTGSFFGGDLLGVLLQRSGVAQSIQPENFNLINYILRLRIWIFTLYTGLLAVLVLIWFIAKKILGWENSGWNLLILGIFGVIYLIIFPNAGYIHNYLTFYLLPFFVLTAAISIDLLTNLRLKGLKVLIFITLIVAVLLERRNYLEALQKSDADKDSVIIGKRINLETKPDDVVLITPYKYFYSGDNFLKFYSDRRLVYSDSRNVNSDYLVEINGSDFEIIKIR